MNQLQEAKANVKKILKRGIVDRDIGQTELAEMLGTNQSQLSRAINGGTTPKDFELQNKLAKILGVEI